MLLPMIAGSVYSSLKTAELNMKWQQRKNNANQDLTDARSREIAQLQKTAANVRKNNLISSIDGKLKAGAELTDDELAYLKQNNPQLYQEAVQIRQERQAYEKALENCRTKDDVDRLKSQKMQQCLTQAKTIANNPAIPEGEKQRQLEKILKRTMGVCREHAKFTQTPQYAGLPREYELEEAKKKREREKADACETTDEKTELYLSDEEMQKKLDDLRNGVEADSAGGAEDAAQPAPGSQETEAAQEKPAAPESPAKGSVSGFTYDAAGNRSAPRAARAVRLDMKR